MPKRRIVQDSDEEDNADPSPVRQAKRAPAVPSPPASTIVDLNSSHQTKPSIQSAGPSTGSTGQLNREIQSAHISLLEPSTSSPPSLPSFSSPSSLLKQAKAAPEQRGSKKPRITYGGRRSLDDLAFASNSNAEHPIQPAKKAKRATSTLPFANDGSGSESGGQDITSSSLSLEENVVNSKRVSTPAITVKVGSGWCQTSITSMPPPVSRSSEATQQDMQSSFASKIPNTERPSPPLGAVSKTRKRAISEFELPKITLGEEIAPSSSAPASSPVKRVRTASRRGDSALSNPRKDADGGYDDLLLLATDSPITGKKQTRITAKNPSGRNNKVNEPEMDDLIPDTPAENYLPRPSRSRSDLTADTVVIPTDFSKRPESLAKKKTKSKREKTAAPEELDQHARASPQRRYAKRASETILEDLDKTLNDTAMEGRLDVESNAALETTIDLTISPTNPPSPKPPPPKKSRGRPKKEANVGDSVHPSILESISVNRSASLETFTVETPAPASIPAKRGRKRKKVPDEEKSSAVVHDDPSSVDGLKDPVSITRGILSDTDPNIRPSTEEPATLKEENPESLKLEPTASSLSAKSTKSTESPNKQTSVKTEERKSLEVGKEIPAGYRVGLSKRQRIAPLLRVVRK
ncbi:MAG: hypothetical protein Q9171_002468 [Xanthocarpia ochracea]